jgi:hypothetical protein
LNSTFSFFRILSWNGRRRFSLLHLNAVYHHNRPSCPEPLLNAINDSRIEYSQSQVYYHLSHS